MRKLRFHEKGMLIKMKKLLYKELHLAASPLSYFFLAAALLTLIPGYPILLGAFFTTLGIFYSYQTMRENNDITYSLLLPIPKAAVVKSKFAFTVFIELCSFFAMTVLTALRMTLFKNVQPYTANPLMGANLVFLGYVLLIFGLFNLIFVRGFFRTAYYFGKPFILYCIVCMLVIAVAEALYHFPGMEALNAFGFDHIGVQLSFLAAGIVCFLVLSYMAVKQSVKMFEKLDM